MNELTRSIDTVTAEIVMIRDNAAATFKRAVVEIGKRLTEAKELVQQGQWTDYLSTLGYKPSTAQNYMRIAREFGDQQLLLTSSTTDDMFATLGYSQLLPLLGLSAEERQEIAEGNENLSEMSSRQIDKLVEDYKAAKAAEERAAQTAADLSDKLKKAEKAQEKAEQAEKASEAAKTAAEAKAAEMSGRVDSLLQEIESMKNEPIPATMTDVSEERLEELREEVRAEQRAAVEAAEKRAKEAEDKLDKAKNPAAHKVNFLFGELRETLTRLDAAMRELQEADEKTAEKFGEVIGGWIREQADDWEGENG